tara:strand:- start:119 stop:355 length:237 start_codon:yes stop_codon:yes gene_type:complete
MGIRTQIKENAYYYFWGAVTLVVVAGQVYVGNGYRRLSETGDAISADINLLIEVISMPTQEEFYFEPDDPYGQMPIIQ